MFLGDDVHTVPSSHLFATGLLGLSGDSGNRFSRSARLSKTIDVAEFLADDRDSMFRTHLRMSRTAFFDLCSIVAPHAVFSQETGREQRSVAFQMFITIWRFAHAATVIQTSFVFAISSASVCYYTARVAEAMMANAHVFCKMPRTGEELNSAATAFEEQFPHFPGCIGVIDGTHIPIWAPREWPSDYYCFKKFYSLNNVCLVNANMEFIFVRSGFPGCRSDVLNFEESELWQMIGDLENQGVYILADTGYPNRPYMVTAYKRGSTGGGSAARRATWNAAVAAVRGLVERAFGLLKGKWRILYGPVHTGSVDMAIAIIFTCFLLHNWCRLKDGPQSEDDEDSDISDDEDSPENQPPSAEDLVFPTTSHDMQMEARGEELRMMLIDRLTWRLGMDDPVRVMRMAGNL